VLFCNFSKNAIFLLRFLWLSKLVTYKIFAVHELVQKEQQINLQSLASIFLVCVAALNFLTYNFILGAFLLEQIV